MGPGTRSGRRTGGRPVAVIDIGSNSARVVVYRPQPGGHLQLVADTRAALRLVVDVDRDHRLSGGAIARTLRALRDFRAVALGAGARRILAVATSAIRDAANGPALLERIYREVGIRARIIDGAREGRFGFLGGVRGLPVTDGLFFDLGGGSMQLSHFHGRRLDRTEILPLGALRLSNAFLSHDPPTRAELGRLKKHVRRELDAAALPRLAAGEILVGTGGTVRNLAKVDARAHRYPITHVHGYVLSREAVRQIAARLAGRRARQRQKVRGLSDQRADSIVGGSFAIASLMQRVGAHELLVSGRGIREGVAYSVSGGQVPTARQVREASIKGLLSRFAAWDTESGARRPRLAVALLETLVTRADPVLTEALGYAARILDVGRSLDFFDRYEHAAEIVLAADLDGFSHRQIALLAAALRTAHHPEGWRSLRPVLAKSDRRQIEQVGAILLLADAIEARCPPGGPVLLSSQLRRGRVRIHVPRLLGWRSGEMAPRLREAFGREVIVEGGSVGTRGSTTRSRRRRARR